MCHIHTLFSDLVSWMKGLPANVNKASDVLVVRAAPSWRPYSSDKWGQEGAGETLPPDLLRGQANRKLEADASPWITRNVATKTESLDQGGQSPSARIGQELGRSSSQFQSSSGIVALDYQESWWCHNMVMLSALLALCEGNPSVTGGCSSQRASDKELSCYPWCLPNKLLNKQSNCHLKSITLMWHYHNECSQTNLVQFWYHGWQYMRSYIVRKEVIRSSFPMIGSSYKEDIFMLTWFLASDTSPWIIRNAVTKIRSATVKRTLVSLEVCPNVPKLGWNWSSAGNLAEIDNLLLPFGFLGPQTIIFIGARVLRMSPIIDILFVRLYDHVF